MNHRDEILLEEYPERPKLAAQGYSVYAYQQSAMPVLLGWAVGSMFAGLFWMRNKSEWLRGFGSQFLGWGAIDGVIAAAGMSGAAKNEQRMMDGEITHIEHTRHAVNFERFVWFNAVLDVGYMLGGLLLAQRSPGDLRRRGMGWGILAQGAFLFIWDIFLASEAQRRRSAPR